MPARSPLHDRTDSQLALRLIGNMKARHESTMPPSTLSLDMQALDEEIIFSEQRLDTLAEQQKINGNLQGSGAHVQVFAELLEETRQELYRLYNARQFLKAEKMTNDGMPPEQIAEVLEQGDSLFLQHRNAR
jgi:hypothetical protein